MARLLSGGCRCLSTLRLGTIAALFDTCCLAGQTAQIVKLGAANNATVRAILQADGAEVTRREFPVNLAASGMTSLSWPVTTPSGKVLTAVVTAIVANDARADNNQAQATTSVAIALQRQLSPMILQVQPK